MDTYGIHEGNPFYELFHGASLHQAVEWSYAYLASSAAKIVRGYGITILVTVVGTLGSCIMTIMFAYPLSRKELPFRYGFSFFVFLTMLFNGGLVPTYMMWTQTFHIKNTIWALIIPGLLMNGFYIIMMRSFFNANIPDEIVEAARIDGAGEYRILGQIVLPLLKPMLATMVLAIYPFFQRYFVKGIVVGGVKG